MTKTRLPVPMLPDEIISTKEAAYRVQVTERTIRRWVRNDGIGRQSDPGASIQVSIIALEMRVNGDHEALDLLRNNLRRASAVRQYTDRLGLINPAAQTSSEDKSSEEPFDKLL